jgi:hypothetical protein
MMNTLIKLTMAGLLVLGTAHVHANEVDLDVTDILTETLSHYIANTKHELENSIKNTLTTNANAVLTDLISPPVLLGAEPNQLVATTCKPTVQQ